MGDKHRVPSNEFERLVRFTFVDSVRGQTLPFAPGHVKEAKLVSEVVGMKGNRVELKFRGTVHTEQEAPQKRGFKGDQVFRTRGLALVRPVLQRFLDRGDFRQDDLAPSSIGFVVQLATEKSADTVAPAFWYAYGR